MNRSVLVWLAKCIHKESITKALAFVWLLIYYIYLRNTEDTYDQKSLVFFKSFFLFSLYVTCQFLARLYLAIKDDSLLPPYKTIGTGFGVFGIVGFIISFYYILLH